MGKCGHREKYLKMRHYKLAFCQFPGSGEIRKECSLWFARTLVEMKQEMWSRGPLEAVLDVTITDTPITMSRNRAVKDALSAGCDYILMIDSDMGPDYLVGIDPMARPFWKTAWNFLINRRREEEQERDHLLERATTDLAAVDRHIREQFPPAMIAAPYCGPPPMEQPFIFKWKSQETNCPDASFRLQMFEREEAAIRSGIEEVAALPTGLILYDARIFVETRPKDDKDPPWFDYEYKDNEQTEKATTEDVYQTRNASLLGMPCHVAWDCWAKHFKVKGIERPHVVTADQVHQTLVDAVKAGRHSRERIRFVSRLDHEPLRSEHAHQNLDRKDRHNGDDHDPEDLDRPGRDSNTRVLQHHKQDANH